MRKFNPKIVYFLLIQMVQNLVSRCICCDNQNFKIYVRNSYMGFRVFQCISCGLYVSGGDEDEMRQKADQIYEKEYWDKEGSEEAIKSDYTNPRSVVLKKRWFSQINYIGTLLSKKKTILEIGAGGGQALFWFSQAGFMVTGIEPDKRNVDLINAKLGQNGICLVGTGEDLEIEKKFDVIWMSHVLEHTIRPDLVFKKIHSILNDDGILFIEVPNCSNRQVLDSSINANPSTFHFTKKSLLELGERNGYKTIKSDFFIPTRTFRERYKRAMEKYLNVSLDEAPFHYKITDNEKAGVDLRTLFLKN